MQIIQHKMPVNFNLFLLSDTHLGTVLCHEDGMRQAVKNMQTEQYGLPASANYWHFGGDAIEAITVDDRRYDLALAKHPTEGIQVQADAFVEMMWPVRKKCVGVHKGNHEHTLIKVMNFSAYIAKRLGAPYATFSAVYHYLDYQGELMFKHFATHGRKSITSTCDDPKRRKTNMELILKRHLREMMGDCLLMTKGHCFSSDTEILTRGGWKFHQDVRRGDEVLTFNTVTEAAEWQPVQAKYVHTEKYSEMVEYKSMTFNFKVTKEHRVIFRLGAAEKWREMPASEGLERSQFTIPVAGFRKESEYPELSDDMISLLGWLISEGGFRSNGAVNLYQSWGRHLAIADLLDRLGIKYSIYRRKFEGREFRDPYSGTYYRTKHDGAVFYIGVNDSSEITKLIRSKRIPEVAWGFSDDQFLIFLRALVAGDGTWNAGEGSGYYWSVDETLIDDLQSLCAMHGWHSIKKYRKKCFELSLCRIHTRAIIISNPKSSNPSSIVPATKEVWCVTVPNGTVFVRREGKVAVLGNTHKCLICEPDSKMYLVTDVDEPVTEDSEAKKHIHHKYTHSRRAAGYIHPDHRWYVNTGAFYRLFTLGDDGYAERSEYDPIELAYPVVLVRNRTIVDVKKVLLD